MNGRPRGTRDIARAGARRFAARDGGTHRTGRTHRSAADPDRRARP